MEATRYPWVQAVRKLHRVQRPQLRDSVEETLWASGEPHNCSEPCVAHCLVGMWRQGVNLKPDWPSVTRQRFNIFSPASIIFGVWSIPGSTDEASGQFWNASPGAEVQALEERLTGLRPNRAVLVKERCQTTGCWRNLSRMKCDWLGNLYKAQVPYLACDIQVDRVRQCMALVREYERDQGMKFDWVTRNRIDHKWHPSVPVTSLNRSLTYLAPWCEGNRARMCYGGFDWWYAMPRAHADVMSGFRDGIECNAVNREELLKYDPVLRTPINCFRNLGCEGWLAAWMFGHNVPFTALGCSHMTGK